MGDNAWAYNGGVAESVATGEWPGDNGVRAPWTSTLANMFVFNSPICNTGCQAACEGGNCSKSGTKDAPTLRGFVYVGGNAYIHENMVIHGVFYVPNGSIQVDAGKTLKVYYDPAVFQRILSANPPPLQVRWSEVNCDLQNPPFIIGSINCRYR